MVVQNWVQEISLKLKTKETVISCLDSPYTSSFAECATLQLLYESEQSFWHIKYEYKNPAKQRYVTSISLFIKILVLGWQNPYLGL